RASLVQRPGHLTTLRLGPPRPGWDQAAVGKAGAVRRSGEPGLPAAGRTHDRQSEAARLRALAGLPVRGARVSLLALARPPWRSARAEQAVARCGDRRHRELEARPARRAREFGERLREDGRGPGRRDGAAPRGVVPGAGP